jgi:hypothetical protein
MLSTVILKSGTAAQSKISPKISECDVFSTFLCFSSPANYCTDTTYKILINGRSQRLPSTNPLTAFSNALKPSPASLRAQRQAFQTPGFHTPNSNPSHEWI